MLDEINQDDLNSLINEYLSCLNATNEIAKAKREDILSMENRTYTEKDIAHFIKLSLKILEAQREQLVALESLCEWFKSNAPTSREYLSYIVALEAHKATIKSEETLVSYLRGTADKESLDEKCLVAVTLQEISNKVGSALLENPTEELSTTIPIVVPGIGKLN